MKTFRLCNTAPSHSFECPLFQYNKEELTDIMSAQLSEEMGLDMRRDYVRLVLSVFYSVAR
jgi:hypothetical protein